MLIDSVYSTHGLCSPKQEYIRLEPDRKNHPYVFVDYTQHPVIENATNDFFKRFPNLLNLAISFVQVRIDCIHDMEEACR